MKKDVISKLAQETYCKLTFIVNTLQLDRTSYMNCTNLSASSLLLSYETGSETLVSEFQVSPSMRKDRV